MVPKKTSKCYPLRPFSKYNKKKHSNDTEQITAHTSQRIEYFIYNNTTAVIAAVGIRLRTSIYIPIYNITCIVTTPSPYCSPNFKTHHMYRHIIFVCWIYRTKRANQKSPLIQSRSTHMHIYIRTYAAILRMRIAHRIITTNKRDRIWI